MINKEWVELQMRFESAYPNFCKHLVKRAPLITDGELQVAICCRLMFRVKDIEQLLGMTESAVMNARYRIRVKAKIPKKSDISSWLTKL